MDKTPSKAEQVAALRLARVERSKSSDGGEKKHPRTDGSGKASAALPEGPTQITQIKRGAGVAPGPSGTKRGRPRIGETRDKPWVAAGMSRSTWYRRKAELK